MKTKFLLVVFFITVFFNVTALAESDTLVFAIDLIRHGDRTPIKEIPAIQYKWPEGLGQLTAKGMQQEFNLGAEKRKIYVDSTHLLSKNYVSGEILVHSSDYDRTLMSAESFLMGLYPPGTGPSTGDPLAPALPNAFQPVPIHTSPKLFDKVLFPVSEQIEAAFYNKPFPGADKKLAELQPKFAEWSKVTGMNITDFRQIKTLADNLFISQFHHIPLPQGLSQKDADEIIATGRWVFVNEFKSPQIGKIFSQNLLGVITNYLQAASLQSLPLKYILFSAHDSTIMGLMNRLGSPLDEAPHYASNVNFSLYKNNKDYYVKVTYNGTPISLPQCGEINCPLNKFIGIIKN